MTHLRQSHESGWGWGRTLAAVSLGLFHYSEPRGPTPALLPKKAGSCDPGGDLRPQYEDCTPLKEDLPKAGDWQK